MKTNSKNRKFSFTSLIVRIIYFFTFIFISGNMFSQNTNCNAKLEVINNKFSKKAGLSGVSYRLRLTNTGFDASNFELKLVNDNLTSNKGRPILNNNRLNISGDFYNVSLKKMKSSKSNLIVNNKGNKTPENNGIVLLLKGKESLDFIVKMKTPLGARIGSINKSQVQVISEKCKNSTIAVLIETQIIDGE